ncbi:hypothetical protein ACOJVU_20785 [Mycobacterium sp. THU-M104]|uniref:hypothetical protein n=1 Tax=Mycobacterium sp. THU-M104 TaxID=3410515 RepID=UPI003B9AC25A
MDPQKKLAGDLELLLGEVGRNPEDTRSVLHLGQTYYDMGDFVNARKWYARRAEMGGSTEEIYHALYQVAASMMQLGAPWPGTQDVLLQAWDVRPNRAEPLYVIAQQHRGNQRYRLGYLFARVARRNSVPRVGYVDGPGRYLRVARSRGVGGVRIEDRQARRDVCHVPDAAVSPRYPRGGSPADRGQPRCLRADDDRRGILLPRHGGDGFGAAQGREAKRF